MFPVFFTLTIYGMTGAELKQVNVFAKAIHYNQHLPERLRRAKEFIQLSFGTDVSLEVMSQVACMEKHHFLREFKKQFNITPWKLLQYTRLQEANRLLSTTDKKIHDICLEVGYKDSTSFTRLFKSRFGFTPGSVRRIDSAR